MRTCQLGVRALGAFACGWASLREYRPKINRIREGYSASGNPHGILTASIPVGDITTGHKPARRGRVIPMMITLFEAHEDKDGGAS